MLWGKKRNPVVFSICISIFLICLLGMKYSVKAASGVTISDYKLYIGDTVITDEASAPTISDGDDILVSFNWELSDDDKDTTSFTLDLGATIKNIQIVQTSGDILNNKTKVGTYAIDEAGKLTVNFIASTDFFQGSARKGGLSIQGKIAVDDDTNPTADTINVQLGQINMNLPYKNNAKVDLQKQAGTISVVGDKLMQTFTVTMQAVDGNVKLNRFSDTMGSGLTGMTEITVTESTASNITELTQNSKYSMEDLNDGLKDKVLKKDEKLVFEYSVEVDNRIYDSNAKAADYTNTATVEYNDNPENPATDTTVTTVTKPKVTKKGEWVDADTKEQIRWTISIKLNDFANWNNVTLEGLDTPGQGHDDTSVKNLTKDKFTYDSANDVYTYTYVAEVADGYFESTTNNMIYNNVSIDLAYPSYGEHTYEASGGIEIPTEGWISKKYVHFDEVNKIVTWEITLDPIPTGITSLIQINDVLSGGQKFIEEDPITLVWNDGSQVLEERQGSSMASNVKGDYRYRETENHITIALSRDFIAEQEGKKVTISVKSKIPDEITDSFEQSIYKNEAQVYYTQNGTQYKPEVTAEFLDTSQCVYKEGKEETKEENKVDGKPTITYDIYIDMMKVDIAEGKVIHIEDTLPDGLCLDEDTFQGEYINRSNSAISNKVWINHSNFKSNNIESFTYSENKISLDIKVDQELYNYWKNERKDNAIDRRAIHLTYKAYVEDESTFVKNGISVNFTNEVTGTYDGDDIGSMKYTVTLTPKSVVNKSIVDDGNNSNIVPYYIEVNKDKLNLSDGELIGEDKLGWGLAYVLDDATHPVVVERYVNDAWQTLSDDEYSYRYFPESNSLKFTLPDEEYLRISYYAYINIRPDYYDEEAVTNEFNLEGVKAISEDGMEILALARISSVAWTEYQGKITLYKYYYGSNGEMVPLPSAKFDLYTTELNGNTLELKERVQDSIVVGNDGKVDINNLIGDTIYALVETEAPSGFERNSEPCYFILPKSNVPQIPSGYTVQVLVDGSPLYFENTRVGTGYLEIAKSVTGISEWSEVADGIEFVVTKGGEDVCTLNGTDLDPTTRSKLIEVNAGTYEITEKVTLPDDHVCKTTYTVNSNPTQSGLKATGVIVNEGIVTKVLFHNTYTEEDLPEQPAKPDQSEMKPSSSATQNNAGENSQIIVTNQLDNTNGKADSGMYTSPQTGRASMLWVVVVFIASGIGLAVVIKQIYRSRKRVEP